MMRVPIGKFFATSEFCSRDSCASENCWNRGIDFKKVMAEPPIAELSVAAPKGSCFGTRTRLPVVFESRFEPEKSREDPSAPGSSAAARRARREGRAKLADLGALVTQLVFESLAVLALVLESAAQLGHLLFAPSELLLLRRLRGRALEDHVDERLRHIRFDARVTSRSVRRRSQGRTSRSGTAVVASGPRGRRDATGTKLGTGELCSMRPAHLGCLARGCTQRTSTSHGTNAASAGRFHQSKACFVGEGAHTHRTRAFRPRLAAERAIAP